MAPQQDDDTLCELCFSLNLTIDCFLGSAGVESSAQAGRFHKINLPSSNIIQDNARCPFCRLLISAIIESNPDRSDIKDLIANGIDLSLEWIKDGRILDTDAVKTQSTRCLRLFSPNKTISDAYLVLLASNQQNKEFLGRKVVSTSIDLERVRSWLRDCESKHGSRCTPLRSPATKDLQKNPGFRLIDVYSKRITTGVQEPYLALSYCWGTQTFDRLFKRNIDKLQKPEGLTKKSVRLTPTIEHAMELTKLLGYKYIWIDAFCIIQDDPDDWQSITEGMYVIYAGASLTICVGTGDALSGIPGVLEHDRKFSQTTGFYNHDVQLMVFQPAEVYIKRSVWDTRAWTFQERLCSNRCLIVVEGRTYFQCQQSMMCEDIHMEHLSSFSGGAQGWSLMLKELPGRIFADNPLRQYTKFVELYTKRDLTYTRDKLPAFSAIQKLLSESLQSDFRLGLPTAYFDFALLWTPIKPLERIPECPSWSWCGWQNALEYRYETLEGVLSNLSEWLESHTWITWNYETSPEKIEAVWDGTKTGLKGRWRGYDRYPRIHEIVQSQKRELHALPSHQKLVPRKRRLSGGSVHTPCLRFQTHSALFKLDPFAAPKTSTKQDSLLHWCSLSDSEGDWCGTVLLERDWSSRACDRVWECVAISEARDFSTEEHDSWTFYVPKDRVDSQWDLYYVLLLQTDEAGYSERVGLGKVFKDAFKKSAKPGYEWKEIRLK